jgi:hypothetical protein
MTHVHATPLDPDTCGKLKVEREGLEQAGARSNMAKGPEWAKANLAADKLEQIRRLIELEGQLLFRCSGQRLIELPAGVEADPVAATASDDNPEGKDAPAQPKAEAKPAAAKAAPEGKPSPAKAKRRNKAKAAKAKGKADDAYKAPPPADPKANPFPKAPQ